MVTAFVPFALAAMLLVLIPGPDSLIVVRALLHGGRREGVSTATGVLCALGIWIAAACLGLSALLAATRIGYDVLKIAGACYLIWLGARALWSLREPKATATRESDVAPQTGRILVHSAFARGFLTDILNPKIGITFISLLPGFVPRGYPAGVTTLGLGIFYAALTAAYFTVLIAASGTVTAWMQSPAIRRRLDALTGMVLVGFGLRLATE